jgi:hypothetical protein
MLSHQPAIPRCICSVGSVPADIEIEFSSGSNTFVPWMLRLPGNFGSLNSTHPRKYMRPDQLHIE